MSLVVLKTLSGSRAHGLALPDSDRDVREIFVSPTSSLLKIGQKPPTHVSDTKGNEEQFGYEIGRFLELALQSNPTILELFKAPVLEATSEGQALRDLFPYVWDSKRVRDAFSGYSRAQHRRMFDGDAGEFKKRWKYAVAHLRVLLQGIELLTTNSFSVKVRSVYGPDIEGGALRVFERYGSTWPEVLLKVKAGDVPVGVVIDSAELLKERLNNAYLVNANHHPDLERVDEVLLRIRKEHWDA